MNVSLPDEMKRFVDQQVRDGDYVGASDYVRTLVRREQRAAAEAKLRQLIAEGLASGPAMPVDQAFFDDLRMRVRARSRKTVIAANLPWRRTEASRVQPLAGMAGEVERGVT